MRDLEQKLKYASILNIREREKYTHFLFDDGHFYRHLLTTLTLHWLTSVWRNNPSDSDRGDNDDNDLEDDYGDDEEDNGGEDNDDGDDIKLHLRVNIGAGVVHDGVWISQEELHT